MKLKNIRLTLANVNTTTNKRDMEAVETSVNRVRQEDGTLGRDFSMLSDKYQKEQEGLAVVIDSLQQQLARETQKAMDAEKWISLIKQYTYPTELTAEMLNAFIEKILVHEAVKDENGNRVQEVEIFYRFIVRID